MDKMENKKIATTSIYKTVSVKTKCRFPTIKQKKTCNTSKKMIFTKLESLNREHDLQDIL